MKIIRRKPQEVSRILFSLVQFRMEIEVMESERSLKDYCLVLINRYLLPVVYSPYHFFSSVSK